MNQRQSIRIPEPSVRRLPLYAGFLRELKDQEKDSVSCTDIAGKFGFLPIQVRKDLAVTGITGKPKIGYQVEELLKAIEDFLGWNNCEDAFLVGAGNLGSTLIGYEKFKTLGLNIVSVFDDNPRKVGKKISGCEVLPIGKLGSLIERMHIKIGIITVPMESAQEIADIMVNAGIMAIWNFCPTLLNLPDSVIVENVRLSSSLSVLTNKLREKLKNP